MRAKQGVALARAIVALVRVAGQLDDHGKPTYRSITALLPRWLPQNASVAERMAVVVCAQYAPSRAKAVVSVGGCTGAL